MSGDGTFLFLTRLTVVVMVSMECTDSLGTNLNIGKHKRVVGKPGSQRETSAGRSQLVRQGQWNDIFETWIFKNKITSLADLGLSEAQMMKSIHRRSTERIQKVFTKTSRGEPIRMVVIGGSNSVGAGIPNIREIYFNAVADWWNKSIKPQTGSPLVYTNLALGGTGSDLFEFCLKNFIVTDDVDIVFVEVSITDFPHSSEFDQTNMAGIYGRGVKPLELLTRQLLALKSAPAVFYINLSVVNQANPKCLSLVNLGQNEVADHYQITTFSWLDLACPLRGTERWVDIKPGFVSEDGTHIGVTAHAQLAWMIIRYFQSVLAQINESGKLPAPGEPWAGESPLLTTLPQPLYTATPQTAGVSACCTWITPNYKQPTTNQLLQVTVTKNHGFVFVNAEHSRLDYKSERTDAFAHWGAKEVGCLIEFNLVIPPHHDINVLQSQSNIIGMILRTSGHGGQASVCILPNNPDLRCKGKWEQVSLSFAFKRTVIYPILTNIQQRNYKVVVQVLGKGEINICGFVVGPGEGFLYKVLH